jgi:hypothetical protein
VISLVIGDDCWGWTGSVDVRKGRRNVYGVITDGGKRMYIHRLAYELFRGQIPEGMTVDHLCRTTLCCRPEHLDVCSAVENARRAPERPWNSQRTQCVHGHPFNEATTYVDPRGARQCRICRAKARRRSRQT